MTTPRSSTPPTPWRRSRTRFAILLLGLSAIALYVSLRTGDPRATLPRGENNSVADASQGSATHEVTQSHKAATPSITQGSAVPTIATTRTENFIDPLATLSAALDLPAGAQREQAVLVALSLWATTDFEAAGKWAASQRLVDATWALDAVLQGARENQEAGKRLIVQLTQLHPKRAEDFGAQWIRALGSFGEHQSAAAFATTATGSSERLWMSLAFAQWAQLDPEAAVLAATELDVPDQRRSAFETVAAVWAKTNPRDLARFALRLPAGPERNLSILSALRSWSAVDANAAANWIQANKDHLTNIPRLELILED